MHNRKQMQFSMSSTKEKQISAYQKSLGSAVKLDRTITSMPQVRITNGLVKHARKQSADYRPPTQGALRMPITRYLSSHNQHDSSLVHQSDVTNQTAVTGIFCEVSAHHRFSKNATSIKKVSLMDSAEQRRQPSRGILGKPPVAVTTGAERISAFEEIAPTSSLVHNTPYNVQRQRNDCLEQTASTANQQLLKRALHSASSSDYNSRQSLTLSKGLSQHASMIPTRFKTSMMQTSNLQKTEVMSTTGLFNNCSNPLAMTR